MIFSSSERTLCPPDPVRGDPGVFRVSRVISEPASHLSYRWLLFGGGTSGVHCVDGDLDQRPTYVTFPRQ